MRILLLMVLFLMFNSSSWAYLTAGKIAVTATSSSSGVPSTSQDSDITNTKGTSVAVGVPVAVTGNVNITGVYQVNGTPISATSNWNQNGSAINYIAGNVSIGSSAPGGLLTIIGGNVGIGSNVPGQALDVVGTVRATTFSGSSVGTIVTGSLNSCVLAASDLFVVAYSNNGSDVLAGLYSTDSSCGSTAQSFNSSAGTLLGNISYMVKKGNHWKVTSTAGTATVLVTPIGS